MERIGYILFVTGLAIGLGLGSLGFGSPTALLGGEMSLQDQRMNQSEQIIPSIIETTFTESFRPDEIDIEQGLSLTGQTDGREDLYVRDRDSYMATHWRVGGMHNWAGVLFAPNTSDVVDRRYYMEVEMPSLNRSSLEWSRVLQHVFVDRVQENQLRCQVTERADGRVYECQRYQQENNTAEGTVYRFNPDESLISVVGCERDVSSPLYNSNTCLLGPGGVL